MDSDVKNHIINVMKSGTGGCKHLEISQALNCSRCQMKILHAQSELKRLSKEHPEKFIRKEREMRNPHIEELKNKMDDREKTDRLYREHIRLLAHGTAEEKIREHKREMSGFYVRHTGDSVRKTIL